MTVRLAALLLLALSPTPLHAQYTVAGSVTLLERAGAPRVDASATIVYLEGGPASTRGADTLPSTASIAMRGREFLPHVRLVRAGGSVAFPNQDPFAHNVFSNTETGSFDLGLYRRGRTRAAAFKSGVYPIYCNIHVRMVSFVVAVPTRHVATVDRDGRFRLPDVAPGSYRLVAWHERAPTVVQRVDVVAGDATVRVTLDTRGHVAGLHLNKFGLPYAVTRTDRYE